MISGWGPALAGLGVGLVVLVGCAWLFWRGFTADVNGPLYLLAAVLLWFAGGAVVVWLITR